MKNPVRNQMLSLAAYVVAAEAHADRLAPIINSHRDSGDLRWANILTRRSRSYRIRALEARANLLALAGDGQTTPLA